jgi:hypothetical protein
MGGFSLTDGFLRAAVELQKEQANKLFKAILLFYQNRLHPSLNYEKLSGTAVSLHSIRIDDNFRVILQDTTPTAFLFVGKHDKAYRFAEGVRPIIRARIHGPQPA